MGHCLRGKSEATCAVYNDAGAWGARGGNSIPARRLLAGDSWRHRDQVPAAPLKLSQFHTGLHTPAECASGIAQALRTVMLRFAAHERAWLCRIWNLLAGGQLLARMANHQKTVTSLCTANSAGPAATSAPRLLSGSLDGHVKVHRLPKPLSVHAEPTSAIVALCTLIGSFNALRLSYPASTVASLRHRHAVPLIKRTSSRAIHMARRGSTCTHAQCGHLTLEEEASFCLGILWTRGCALCRCTSWTASKCPMQQSTRGPSSAWPFRPTLPCWLWAWRTATCMCAGTPITRVLFLGCQVSPK